MTRPASARPPTSLVVWMAVCALLFLMAPAPPEAPGLTDEEVAAMNRVTGFVVRDVRKWQAEKGDLSLPWKEARGHLAIVIDDVGRELHLLEKLQSLRWRLTFSVLPGAVYAPGAQLRLRGDRRRYREIWLHLPMEPLDTRQMLEGPEAQETFLRVDDPPTTLVEKLEAALARVPAAVGVNNHMGSRLTTDRQAMAAIMPVLRERNLMFLDSRTHADTVAETVARQTGVVTGARHVFLDHVATHEAIDAELTRAAELALEQPTIAIGHPSVPLYEILERRLPELHAQGIGIYPLSLLLERSAQ